MPTSLPDVVARYFELDSDRSIEPLVALFAADATVVDEGETRHGTEAIRGWQTGAASTYEYTTTILSSEPLDGPDHIRVRARLDGNFPGGTAELNFDFSVEGDRITRLEIAP